MNKLTLLCLAAGLTASSAFSAEVVVFGDRFDLNPINNFYNSIGHTSVIGSGTLDTINLTGTKLLWAVQPADAYTAAELNTMHNFLQGGGRIAFMGEHGFYAPDENDRINAAISFLGGSITIQNLAPDAGFRSASVADGQILANPLTEGVLTYQYACFAPLILSGSAEALMHGEDDPTQIMMAYQVVGNGSIFLITDQNVWDNESSDWPGFNNHRMFENLLSATVPGQPTVDNPGAVPEPSTYGLIGAVALVGLAAVRRFKKQAA